jgi:hypothetical protein
MAFLGTSAWNALLNGGGRQGGPGQRHRLFRFLGVGAAYLLPKHDVTGICGKDRSLTCAARFSQFRAGTIRERMRKYLRCGV